MNIENIALEFKCRVKSWKPLRAVFLVYTDKGTKIIKESKKEPEKLIYIHGLKEYLYDRGFHNLDRFLPSALGLPFVINDNRVFIMEDFIEGRECSFSNPYDRAGAMRTLAKLHVCGRGYTTPIGAVERNDIGKWEKTYLRKINDLENFKREVLSKKKKDTFDKMFLQDVDFFMEMAWIAYDTLKNSKYQYLSKKAEKEWPICHHDYTYHNIIIGRKEIVNVIDFDYSCHELPIYDIAAVILRVMRRLSYDLDTALTMLYDYDLVRPISDNELPLLMSLLEFPQKFWRLTNRYYSGKDGWSEKKFINKYFEIIDDKEFMIDFLRDFKKFIT